MFARRVFLVGVVALAATPIFAGTEVYSKNGMAIEGYDPVAYFTQSKAVRGKSEFSSSYLGATFLFSSKDNKNLFESNPKKYAPEFGGHCAWAASQGYIAKSDPRAWTVHGGKLYLNYNKSIRKKWLRNIDSNIAKGDANWPSLKASL